jgi:streptogramin lyase
MRGRQHVLVGGLLIVILVAARLAPAQGFLYVSDGANNRILEFDLNGSLVQSFASPLLDDPHGLAFDSNGNLYIANVSNNTIAKLNQSGVFGTFMTGLNSPLDLASDGTNLYLASQGSNVISKITPAKNISGFATMPANFAAGGLVYDPTTSLLWAGDTDGNGGLDRITTTASITTFSLSGDTPDGLGIDSSDNVWFASNSSNPRYGNISTTTGTITEYAASFDPIGMTGDPQGNMYTALGDGTGRINRVRFGISSPLDINTVNTGVSGTPNDVVYSSVQLPEPSSVLLLGAAACALTARRRRSGN